MRINIDPGKPFTYKQHPLQEVYKFLCLSFQISETEQYTNGNSSINATE